MSLIEHRTDDATPPAVPETAVLAAWEPVHCRKCKRLLCRVTVRALRPSEMFETKCKCGTLNYLVGTQENP